MSDTPSLRSVVYYQPITMPNNIISQYWRRIENPIEYLRWSLFAKIVNG